MFLGWPFIKIVKFLQSVKMAAREWGLFPLLQGLESKYFMCGTVSKFLLTTIMYFNWVPPPSPLSCCIVFLHFNKSGLGDTYPTTTLLFVLLIVSD